MNGGAVEKILDGFRFFRPTIHFYAERRAKDLVREAVANEPAVVCYLQSVLVSGALGEAEVRASYRNTDIPREDVRFARTMTECADLICKAVGRYRKTLVVISEARFDPGRIITDFSETEAGFFPNLTRIQVKTMWSQFDYEVMAFSFEYRIGYVKLAQMELEVDAEVKRVAGQLFDPGAPSAAKIYLAHNYLATTVRYLLNNENRLEEGYSYSAYGALILKKCVCQGFAEAFKRLMDAAGIDCNVVFGKVAGEDGFHAWNMVSLGNGSSFYHVDVTWDASGDSPGYEFFCRNDSFFAGKRTWNSEYNPKCEGTFPVLPVARQYVTANKEKLLARGIAPKILDC
ncbi:MAG: hypothetical protein IJM50_01005 [Lachnospiraceae bacterium]|nr:hypothetical protein [Lachnospiraceae bacterium]